MVATGCRPEGRIHRQCQLLGPAAVCQPVYSSTSLHISRVRATKLSAQIVGQAAGLIGHSIRITPENDATSSEFSMKNREPVPPAESATPPPAKTWAGTPRRRPTRARCAGPPPRHGCGAAAAHAAACPVRIDASSDRVMGKYQLWCAFPTAAPWMCCSGTTCSSLPRYE